MSNKPKLALSLLTSLVLIGGACSSSSSSDSSSDGAQTDGDNETAADYESPLFDFLGFDTNFGSDEAKAKQAQTEREAQEKITTCMRAEGFEYTPTDNSSFQAFTGGEDGLEYGSKGWVEKYGFGVSTQAFSQEQVGPDLVGHNFGDFLSPPDSKDPNQVYLESLPPGEQEAYYAALYGADDGPEYDASLSEEENEAILNEYYGPDYQPTGCFSSSFGDQFGNINAFFEEFADEMDELEQRFEADPRVTEARAKIKTCVSDKGYDYTNQEDAFNDLQERISDIGGGGGNVVLLDDGSGSDDDLTDEQIEQQFFEQGNLSDDEKTKLATAQEYELGLALAVYECSGNSLDDSSNPELSKIRIDMEQEFLDANQDRLAQFKGTSG